MTKPQQIARKEPVEEQAISLGRLDDFLGFRLRRLQNHLAREFAEATADRQLRSGLFTSLAIIAANPGISQNELSRQVGLDKSVMVLIVDDLEKEGWAVRERSTVDRRRHCLSILPAGAAYLDELFVILERTEKVVSERLTAAEHHLLHELLDRVFESVEARIPENSTR